MSSSLIRWRKRVVDYVGPFYILSVETGLKLEALPWAGGGRRRCVDKARSQHLSAQSHREWYSIGVRFGESSCIQPSSFGGVS